MREKRSYLPGRSIDQLRISDVTLAIESRGTPLSELPFFRAKELGSFEKALSVFQDLIEKSDENRFLAEI